MSILRNTSIRKKLMWMLLLTSGSAILLSVIGFGVNDWLSLRQMMVERLQVQAEIIGVNSVAALTFGDLESAYNTLASLKKEADIVGAVLYTKQGEAFVQYTRDGDSFPSIRPNDLAGTLKGSLFVVAPIHLDGKVIGNVMVISDLSAWKHQQLIHVVITFGIFLVSLLVALLLSNRLQRAVSEPILKLAATAREVFEYQDYHLRAEKLSFDEIGSLVDNFNRMLGQIQQRDQALQHARDQLDEKVQARTWELTEMTRQLKHLAYHDTLTGLANRTTFDDHLRLAIDQAKRHQKSLAVFFLDLDRFKGINDTLGHGVGDQLLIEISHRLSACVRNSDTLARLGGDEFAILLSQIRQDTDVAEVAAKITEAIAQPIHIDGYHLHVTSSIGISLFPDDGSSTDIIVKNADTAMYRSKDRGRNQFTFFSSEMNQRAARRLTVETKLRHAIESNMLTVHYQPRCDAHSLQISGVEALVRWTDPEEGIMLPVEFIPLAEECGLIAAIDEWVLERACCEMLAICSDHSNHIRLAVNVSPAQFIREDLCHVIADILQRTGFPAERLELEITESLFGPGNFDAYQVLEGIRSLGVQISIDDFGTAYSSLSRLKQLPLHTLKIDQSFIRDLGQDTNDETLVKTIIIMAHNLNLKVVAEGIETDMQYEFVKSFGCDTVQGYLFGKPVSYNDLPFINGQFIANQLL